VLLEPGPFQPIPDEAIQNTELKADFLDFTHGELAELDALSGEVEGHVLDMFDQAAALADPAPEFDAAAVHAAAAAAASGDLSDHAALIDSGMDDANLAFTTAVQSAPVEAWMPPQNPFTPTGDSTVQLDYGGGAVFSAPIGAGPQRGAGHAMDMLYPNPAFNLDFRNETRPEADFFYVGEMLSVHLTGPPQQEIMLNSWHDGAHLAPFSLGTSGQDGTLSFRQPELDDVLGAWLIEFHAGGQLIQSVAFFVKPLPTEE
jgi:hypothetical protein